MTRTKFHTWARTPSSMLYGFLIHINRKRTGNEHHVLKKTMKNQVRRLKFSCSMFIIIVVHVYVLLSNCKEWNQILIRPTNTKKQEKRIKYSTPTQFHKKRGAQQRNKKISNSVKLSGWQFLNSSVHKMNVWTCLIPSNLIGKIWILKNLKKVNKRKISKASHSLFLNSCN